MQNNWDWTLKYYDDAARRKDNANGASCLRDVEKAAAESEQLSGPHAQELAARWRALLAQFTQDDPAI